VTTALYRRYRPDTFADVVGQEHVTEPLMQALRADRVAHAYLFSGPRGCGKTSSARILARCLNCAEGPTDTPCGKCDSCVELARGGSGSVDVVEIDAASHNGVDDARELRERAAFAPARDRYKIFILDEAHMVTTQGFNALLKLVEEPPPHVRFVFATTEPDKVIGTIRSRTHHYPFRLVPPGILVDYLAKLGREEGVEIASGVLPLIVRAGGGSVRDSLSVLDQLIAGSDERGVSYERAISLLGFTDATLLDDAVDAIAAADGASLFSVVGRVVETGHEPRRFVDDLLERLRDLIVLAASGTAGAQALAAASEDQHERMADQARRLGLGRASRVGDLVNDALTGMIGATSPRLHLELLCARLIAAETAVTGSTPPRTPADAPSPAASAPRAPRDGAGADHKGLDAARAAVAAAREESHTSAIPQAPAATTPKAPDAAAAPAPAKPATASTPQTSVAAVPTDSTPAKTPAPDQQPAAEDLVRAPTGDVAGGPADSELVRRRWPEVLGTLERRRVTWAMVSQSAQVSSVEGGVLKLAFDNPAMAARFGAGAHSENLALAVRETLGLHVRVEPIVGPTEPAAATATGTSASSAPPRASSQEPPLPKEPPAEHEDMAHEDMADDDDAAPAAQLSGADVIASMLGGTVVDE